MQVLSTQSDQFKMSNSRRSVPPSAPSPICTMRRTIFVCLAALSFTALAATGPYDEAADAKAQVAAAVADAAKANMPVLVVFGANWCPDCKVLDLAFKEGAAAPLIAKHFKVVKVDVGRFDKNVSIAEGYGVPVKNGIPAIAVLSRKGK